MKLIKPEWIEHGPKESLSSLHINPEGIRVAIAGKYNAVDCIRIFRLASILDENYQKQSRLLCRIDTQCPLCVRFSYTSDVLAVASRQSVLLYHLTATNPNVTNQPVQSSSSFGDFPETWRLRSSLSSGHVADILDIAWSPSNDHYLASCSIDNHICIYAWPSATLVTTLRGHTGLVKGLAWDPTGLLLTSQSSDGTVKVWSSTSWQCEQTIKEPFDGCAESTSFLRLDWSPDGTMFTTAHAKNNTFPVAACVIRGASTVDAEFVGHRREVTCARFLQRILLINGRRRCLLAIGSKDRTLSLWLTSPRQPLCVVNDFFASGILDMSWCLNDDNGLITLGICSPDGACAFIIFNKDELGTPLTRPEMAKFYSDMYKVNMSIPTKAITNGTLMTNGNGHSHHVPPSTTVKATLANQTERRLGDGRRCIKPLCIDTHAAAPPSTTATTISKAPSPSRPTTVSTSVPAPSSNSSSVRPMPTIPIDPKPTKGVIRSSTSSITLPSSISSTALFPPVKLQPNLIRKINNEYELRTEKSDQLYILSCINEKTKLAQWKNVFQSPLLAIQATKNFIAIVTLNETQHCSELFVLQRQSGLRLYSNIVLTQTLAGLYISENANNIQRATISLIYITGLLTVFEITRHSMICPIIDVNISHLLPPHASIVDIFTLNHINSDTVCLITSTGHLYGFDNVLKHWTCLFHKHDFVSDFALPPELTSSGPLSTLTKSYCTTMNDDIYQKNLYSSSNRELLVSAYLETQIHRSRVLHSSREYYFWLTSFVRFLASSSLDDKSLKLKSILDHIAEHVHSTPTNSTTSFMPLKTKDEYQNLLNECLTILRNHDDASTLVQHYEQT
ncbi:unnamed protein product [Rotaria socialis]|uniref:Protein HIRA n=1 Tax=Rotaria socialis TaxID=392032 RepID=A0A817L7R0_9BILA|nr:unnamed protein product [Rotaria socialis]CAF3325566.1 unnamed protein product [Rotaria socialis]CAF3388531.1 unnamed protein product [Rotaria socialis]CAF3423064.1 unnamed protein product [Rotaria socialis]CAF4209442.1 unnamed protein product [Rotaria socialis]